MSSDILYHYTNIAGLIGIFKDKKIWATNINHFNDKKEFQQTISLVREGIEELEQRQLTNESLNKNSKLIEKYKISVRIIESFAKGLYVCSFSEHGDQLSQWRGYCLPAATGFSIGFKRSALEKITQKAANKNTLSKFAQCIYDEKVQKTKIQEIIDLVEAESKETEASMSPVLIAKIGDIAPFFKNKSFAEEAEWRLASYFVSSGHVKFREGRTLIIPYWEIDIMDQDGKIAVDSITIGPSPNQKESTLSLEILLEKEGIKADKINISEIPYREI